MLTDINKSNFRIFIICSIILSLVTIGVLIILSLFEFNAYLIGGIALLIAGIGTSLRVYFNIENNKNVKLSLWIMIILGFIFGVLISVIGAIYCLLVIANAEELKRNNEKIENLDVSVEKKVIDHKTKESLIADETKVNKDNPTD